jgi:hypothetical protein
MIGDCVDGGASGSAGAGTMGAGGSAAGDTGTEVLLAALVAGGLGRYSGPGWPQPLSKTDSAMVVAQVTGAIA